jgi:hypothetical protein
MSTLWFISGDACVVQNDNDETLFTGTLSTLLPGISGTIFESGTDAALQSDEGIFYLFSGNQYGRYDLSTNTLDAGYPLTTAEYWNGLTGLPMAERVTAACNLSVIQSALFSGSNLTIYDLAADTAGPLMTVNEKFPAIPAGTEITAAVSTDLALYLFAGNEYYRITNDQVDEGYPLPVEGNWPALSGFSFAGGFTLRNNVTAAGLELTPPATPDDGGLASTPARALTLDQAKQILQQLHDQGALALTQNSSAAWVSLAEPVMHGVEFRYWNGSVTQKSALRNLDPRNAVGMARLAFWLATTYGAHTIAHIGVNGDDSGVRRDCHGQGRAVDFAGVAGNTGGAEYDLYVLRDWGTLSVPDEQDPAGPRLARWPPGSRALSYRLTDCPESSPLATEMFQAIYTFVAGQWQDGNDQAVGAEPVSIIGQRSFVMNPDHPSSDPTGKSGREAHANHLHFQIGKTGTQ